ncbi:hypothetical protein [Caballeronia sordidicola]|uniref:hypothetical protein n=1 Tax=Caballeronia sordidicola TaxID=196367 RepID=UPI001FC957F9|nr:hypothetical protein [Caballeronia sordidicola]
MSLSKCAKLIAPKTENTVRGAAAIVGLAEPNEGAAPSALLSILVCMVKGWEKSRVAFVIYLDGWWITRFRDFKVSFMHCPAKFCRDPDTEPPRSEGFPCILLIKHRFVTNAENFPKEARVRAVDH